MKCQICKKNKKEVSLIETIFGANYCDECSQSKSKPKEEKK